MEWKYTSQEKPIAYLRGVWDGLNSEQVIAEDANGKKYLAHYCEGLLDGSYFEEWYSDNDYLIETKIIRFLKIPE